MRLKKIKKIKGFSLAEIVVVVAIAGFIFVAILTLGNNIFSFNRYSEQNLSAQSGARRVLKNIAKELRSTSPSSLGSYPIMQVSTSSIIFFSNIDSDQYKERIRYFLQNNEIKKGVIKPSGSPLVYNTANENIVTVIRDVRNGVNPIFEYFDSNYAGTTTPLSYPIQTTNIRLVKIILNIDKDPAKSLGPLIVTTQVFLRNLKDNL